MALGDITGIADSHSEGFPPPLPMAARMQTAAEGSAPVLPIQCDRVRRHYTVTIKYELGWVAFARLGKWGAAPGRRASLVQRHCN